MLRQIFAGEKTKFSGETVRSRGFVLMENPSAPVPIYLAAIGAKMLALAGEIGDGVVLNDFATSDRLDWALSQIDEGAKRGGRRVDDLEVVKRQAFFVTDDVQAGLDYFRDYLGFYASSAVYQNVLKNMGYATEVDEMIAGFKERDRGRVMAVIDDAMLMRIFAFGDEDRCRAWARSNLGAGIDTLVVSPLGTTAAEFERGAEAFRRSNLDFL